MSAKLKSITDQILAITTSRASVRVRVDGRSQIVQTQIRAPKSNDARWLLWAQFGFHSITSGPSKVKQ